MSDQQTYSWQIEAKSGADTRVEGVARADVADDVFSLSDVTGSPLFMAPFSSLSFAKRVEPRGKSSDFGQSIVINVPPGVSAGDAMRREIAAFENRLRP